MSRLWEHAQVLGDKAGAIATKRDAMHLSRLSDDETAATHDAPAATTAVPHAILEEEDLEDAAVVVAREPTQSATRSPSPPPRVSRIKTSKVLQPIVSPGGQHMVDKWQVGQNWGLGGQTPATPETPRKSRGGHVRRQATRNSFLKKLAVETSAFKACNLAAAAASAAQTAAPKHMFLVSPLKTRCLAESEGEQARGAAHRHGISLASTLRRAETWKNPPRYRHFRHAGAAVWMGGRGRGRVWVAR